MQKHQPFVVKREGKPRRHTGMQWVTARAVRRAGASSSQIPTSPTRKGGWRGLPHGGLAGKGYARRYAPLAYARTNGAFHVQPAMAVTRSAQKSSAKSKSKPPSAGRRSGPTAQERLVQGLIELMQQGEAGDPEAAARSWVSYRQVPVSNASDLEGPGLAELIAARQEAAGLQARPEPERPAAAEAVLSAWPVPVSFGGDRAFYLPQLDRIQLPERASFQSAAAFYATWAHEQVHSTGHASRLKRDLGGAFGKPRYAREELVAELGAVLLGDRLEIGSELQSHAAYLEHWIVLLQAEPQVLFQVLGEARQAVELLAAEEGWAVAN